MTNQARAPLGSRDRELLRCGKAVVGIDEVGRGALAGPVVVCGVAFDHIPDRPEIQDSKVLTPRQRVQAAAWVRANCLEWTVIEVWVELIDRINILESTRLAMRAVARTLSRAGATVVVDNVDLGDSSLAALSPPAADSHFFCVAAASIVAKVHRDAVMTRLASSYPKWGWEGNKGYGTRAHRMALGAWGPTFLHRSTFAWSPVLP